mgnify:CR=1 FL=1
MLACLPAPLRGVIASLLLALNTIVCCTPLFIVSLFKLIGDNQALIFQKKS